MNNSSIDTLGIGFIGAGGNAVARHLPGFRSLPGCSLVAVANRSMESARKVAAEWGIARCEDSWRAVVDAPDVHAVCIGTWPSTHSEMTVAALAGGKHVLCEARMAADLAGAHAMAAAAGDRPGLVAQLVPAPLTLEFDRPVRSLIRDGALGLLARVSVRHLNGSFLAREGALPWRLSRRHSGINLLSLGIFYETLVRWLEADAVPTSAAARLRSVPENHPWHGADLPEHVTVLGHFPAMQGCALDMDINFLHEGPPVTEILLEGRDGSLLWDGIAKSVRILRPGSDPQFLDPRAEDAWRVEADFVESIRLSPSVRPVRLTSFADGVSYMRFTDAVFRLIAGKMDPA